MDDQQQQDPIFEPLFSSETYESTVYSDSIALIFKNGESLTFVVPSEKYITFGTESGKVYVINHLGQLAHTFHPFRTPIKYISLDVGGDFIAVISNTSKVFVLDVGSKEVNFSADFGKIVTAIAVCPQIAKSSPKSIAVSTNQRIILYNKFWLNEKKVNIHISDSPINLMSWFGRFLSWTNNTGAGVYNIDTREWISHIPFQENIASKKLLMNYNIHWIDQNHFLVSYGSSIKFCSVKQREPSKVTSPESSKTLPSNFVEITHSFKLDDHNIIGIGYKDSQIICISGPDSSGSVSEEQEKDESSVIVKSIIPCENSSKEFQICSLDKLAVKKSPNCPIKIGFSAKENFLIIISKDSVFFAKPRTCDEVVAWLLENECYTRALDYAKMNAKRILNYNLEEIKKKFLFHNLNNDNCELISKNIDVIGCNDINTWEVVINHFINKKQLHVLCGKLKPYDECQLRPDTYQNIIQYFVDAIPQSASNIQYLSDFILKYHSSNCLDMNYVCTSVETLRNSCFSADRNPDTYIEISNLQALLYQLTKRYTDALDIYVSLHSEECFTILNNHTQDISSKYIIDNLKTIFAINFNKFLNIIINNPQTIQMQSVIEALEVSERSILLRLLKQLHSEDHPIVNSYTDLLICLFVEFKEQNLLELLRQSTNYDVIKTTKLCESHQLYTELVYLYEIVGNHLTALETVATKLQNLDMAIDICKRVEDEDLWNILLNYCIESPEKIKILIESIGYSLNIVKVLNKIPSGFTIPNLNESLKKIMCDYSIRVELNHLCCEIMKNESITSFNTYYKKINQGLSVNHCDVCSICNCLICFTDINCVDCSVSFYCGHCFHQDCLKHNNLSTTTVVDSKLTCPECFLNSTAAKRVR